MAEVENANGLNRNEQQQGDRVADNAQPGQPKVNHPGAVGGRRSEADESTLSQTGLEPDADNFGNTRDPQEVADNNISQYVTGRPV